MRPRTLLVAILSACEAPAPPPPPPPPSVLPSLHGVLIVAASDRSAPAVADRMGPLTSLKPECVSDAYGGIELSADLAPPAGDETVLASFSRGVIVFGADGRRIASTPGFDCAGSQDELVALEIVRTSLDRPVIAVAAIQGGRRESSTWLELLAIGTSDRLDRLFLGEIERRDDRGTHAGDVTMVPGGLVYRHPTEGVSSWKYDSTTRRYVVVRSLEDRRSLNLD